MGILNTKKAFTMAEAILVMTILGIIATIMITTLKPAQFKDKGLEIMARKVLSEIDTAVTQILINDTASGNLFNTIHPNNAGQTFTLGSDLNLTAKIFKKYLTATRQDVSNSSFCKTGSGTVAFYLKDGACIGLFKEEGNINTIFPGETNTVSISLNPTPGTTWFAIMAIYVDTNGDEEPNVISKDRFIFPLNENGIIYSTN